MRLECSQNVLEDTPIVLLFDYQQPLGEHDVGVECGKAIRDVWQGKGHCIKLWCMWLNFLRLECSQNVLEDTPIVLSFDYQQQADRAFLHETSTQHAACGGALAQWCGSKHGG